ncbi:MAG: DUF4194 domain-containing protein [Pirellulaceae bacterium]|nr:DUF4194 domain-containing protein [Planctomycetales bacterium]
MKNIFDRMAAEGAAVSNETDVSSITDVSGMENAPDDSQALSSAAGHRQQANALPGTDTSRDVKQITQELLKHGYMEEAGRTDQFRRIIIHENAIATALEPLDLALRIDSHRGVAYLTVASSVAESDAMTEEEAWSHPLVRRQRLTLEQSLLIAILRHAFVIHEQEMGVGQGAAKIAIDDLLPQYLVYASDSGSDAKNESRLLNLLDQLKAYGVVSEVDKQHEVTIRPLIAHLASPESLASLLQVLKEQTTRGVDREGDD